MKKMVMAALLGMSLVSGTSFGFWCTDAAVENEFRTYKALESVIDDYVWYGGGPSEVIPDIAVKLKEETKHPEVLLNFIRKYVDKLRNYLSTALETDGVYAYEISNPSRDPILYGEPGRPSDIIGVVKGKKELQKLLYRANYLVDFLSGGLQKIFEMYDLSKKGEKMIKQAKAQRVKE